MHPFFYDYIKSTSENNFFAFAFRGFGVFATAFLVAVVAPLGHCKDRFSQNNSSYEKFSGASVASSPFNAYALQYTMRDHHQHEMLYTHDGVSFRKNYQGSAAARKMVQMALRGAWMTYRDHAVAYFLDNDEPEIDEFPERREFGAGLMLFTDTLDYRVRVSSSKVLLNVSYEF